MINEVNIRCFLSVAHNHSFSKAADELFMTRQAVSQQISKLEESLETQLLTRSPRQVELTPMGEEYFALFQETEKRITVLRRHAQMTVDSPSSIRIGYLRTLETIPAFSRAVDCCRKRGWFPDLYSMVFEPDELTSMLAEDRLDIIVSFKVNPALFNDQYDSFSLGEIPQVIMIAAGHPILSQHEVTPQQIFDTLPVAKWSSPAITAQYYTTYFDQWDYNIRQTKLYPNIDSAIFAVESGQCVIVTPYIWNNTRNPAIRTVALDQGKEYALIWKKNTKSECLGVFLEEAVKELKAHPSIY